MHMRYEYETSTRTNWSTVRTLFRIEFDLSSDFRRSLRYSCYTSRPVRLLDFRSPEFIVSRSLGVHFRATRRVHLHIASNSELSLIRQQTRRANLACTTQHNKKLRGEPTVRAECEGAAQRSGRSRRSSCRRRRASACAAATLG